MASHSLHALADRLRDVDDLMEAHAHVQVAHAPDDPGYELDGMNRAAVLMLSAHFEGFARGMDAAVHAHLTTLTGAEPWAAA